MASNGTVVAYFPTQAAVESAINELKNAGFQQSQIGVAARSATQGSVTQGTPVSANDETRTTAHRSTEEHAGGLWDKIRNFFEGNAAEPYAGEASRETFNDREVTPGYGADDVHESLGGMAVPDEHVRYFGNRFRSGNEGAIITVSAPGREEEAVRILEDNGGDLGKAGVQDQYAGDTGNVASSTRDYAGETSDVASDTTEPIVGEQNIQLFGEVLRVHKDRINRGEVRVRKEVRTDSQTVQVPVTREELVVERVPVSGEQPATGGAAFSDQEIRVPLSEERASVDKDAVLREQVRVGKKEVTNVESFDEQVRNEELKVDDNAQNTPGKTA